jgi:plastocyanin
MTTLRRPVLVAATGTAVLLAVGTVALLTARAGADAAAPAVLGPGPVRVRLDIEHSRFEPARVHVRPHTQVRFVVVNHDPIRHELIVGDDALHARHRNGTEAEHPPRPGEVTVDSGSTGSTTATFNRPGVVRYACHLPGHLAYGMKGTVVVEAPRS